MESNVEPSTARRIGLMSDTHGYLDPQVLSFFQECDEVWHAGDIGHLKVAQSLEKAHPFRAVWGNIDGPELRSSYPEIQRFTCAGVKVMMIHIGGYPGRYAKGVGALLKADPPDLFICGHSHILKIMPCPKYGLLHINPGACGRQGFHLEKTVVRFTLDEGKISQLQIGKLGPR